MSKSQAKAKGRIIDAADAFSPEQRLVTVIKPDNGPVIRWIISNMLNVGALLMVLALIIIVVRAFSEISDKDKGGNQQDDPARSQSQIHSSVEKK